MPSKEVKHYPGGFLAELGMVSVSASWHDMQLCPLDTLGKEEGVLSWVEKVFASVNHERRAFDRG